MTWKDLAKKINDMTDEQQYTDVTVLLMNSDEVLGVMDFYLFAIWQGSDAKFAIGQELRIDQVAGVLDNGHPYLIVDF